MYKFKTIRCSSCDSVLLNITEAELEQLDGMLLHCDCCHHINLLRLKVSGKDSGVNIIPIRFPIHEFEEEQVIM
ncbi:MAG: hypothetical protein HGA22_02500 [Clostridiales bacterium]|nr:hypothetical protein [Clostridiales bacterium]